MTFTASPAQQNYFDWIVNDSGNAVIEAVAGAGKTTTIVKGLQFMGGKVFVGAYNSKMGAELKSRTADFPNVFASTFHGAGNKALRYAYNGKFALHTDGKKVANIVEHFCLQRNDLITIAGAVPGIVSMAKQRGIGALVAAGDANDNAVWQTMIDHFGLDDNLPDNARMDQVIAFSRAVLKSSNAKLDVIDFDDMIYLPLLNRLRLFKHEFVLIDEAQDTNPTRRALAASMLAPDGRLVAVGDPHQAIFGFTGADNDSLELIATQFAAKRLPLTVSYRCPKAVVAHARQWVSHIEAHESAPEGSVEQLSYKDLAKVVQPGEAILCRFNKYLVSTCFMLIREGIAAKIEGRQIGAGLMALAERWKSVKTLTTLEDRLEDYRFKEVAKAVAKKQDTRIDTVNDQVDTLKVLIGRARDLGGSTVNDLKGVIDSIFGDNVTGDDIVTLCSAHRSKGLEWDTVYILDRAALMPSRNVTQDWAREQEINLIYVAVTRAKKRLIEVFGVAEKREPRS